MGDILANDPGTHFGLVLVPQFTLGGYAAAIEPLRIANLLSGEELYTWQNLSLDGVPVPASSGLEVSAGALPDEPKNGTYLVCGGVDAHQFQDRRMDAWLRQTSRRNVSMGAICTGAAILARLGLLDGYACTIHWEHLPGLREEFPDLDIREEIFVLDRNRFTCAGGMAPIDMMLHFVREQHGHELAAAVAEEMVYERVRDEQDHQRMALRVRLAVSQPKLLESITIMSENIERPLGQAELAKRVGLSTRQVERLFQRYLHCTPSRYYLEMRLSHARALLQQTTMSVMNVALATGFVSASHFSKSYREHFGHSPRQEKRAA